MPMPVCYTCGHSGLEHAENAFKCEHADCSCKRYNCYDKPTHDNEMTYTKCGVCNGAGHLGTEGEDDWKPCPCTRSSTPGWSPTGVTEKQLERLAESEKTLNDLLSGSTYLATGKLHRLRAEYAKKHGSIIPNAEMGEVR